MYCGPEKKKKRGGKRKGKKRRMLPVHLGGELSYDFR